MQWLIAFIIGISWFALSLITGDDSDMIVANIWMASSLVLASK